MPTYTLHRTNRTKKDGTPKAGPKFEYQVKDAAGTVITSRTTDHDGFLYAYLRGSTWSYSSSRKDVRTDNPHNIAQLVPDLPQA